MEKTYNDKVWYKITKNIIDCDNKTMALKSSAAYNNSGELLDSYTVEDSFLERKDIIPETKGDYWHNIVCDYNNKSSPDLKQKQADETISNEELDEGFIKNGIDFKSYMDEVQKSIKMCWDPPQESRSKRVVLLFSIAKDGNLVGNIKVKKSSGRTEADNAAIRAVNDAAPFKPLPKKFNGKSVDIQFSFDYNVINKAEI